MPELVYSQNRDRLKLAEPSDRELLCRSRRTTSSRWRARGAEDPGPDPGHRPHRPRRGRGPRRRPGRLPEDLGEPGEVRPRWSPNTWIYRIATNLAIDHWRSRRSRDRAGEPIRLHLLRAAESHPTGALAELKEAEVDAIFIELAAELTEKQRLIFLLRETEGLWLRGKWRRSPVARNPRCATISSTPARSCGGSSSSAIPSTPRAETRPRSVPRDLSRLAHPRCGARCRPAVDPPAWAEARRHAAHCDRCRRAALAADPLLLFARLPERA